MEPSLRGTPTVCGSLGHVLKCQSNSCRYCVVLQRQSFLNQAQIDQCLRMAESDHVTNYEARMAAEVQLYWIIYQESCKGQAAMENTNDALQSWKQRWAALFSELHRAPVNAGVVTH